MFFDFAAPNTPNDVLLDIVMTEKLDVVKLAGAEGLN